MRFVSKTKQAAQGEVAGETDIQATMPGMAITRRYLRTGLVVGALVNVFGLLDAGSSALVKISRVLIALFCLVGLALLRQGWSPRSIGRAVAVVFPFAVLWVGLLRAGSDWPVGFSFLPAMLVFGTLVGGTRLSSVVAGAVVVIVGGAYLALGLPHPPYFGIQITNLLLATAFLHLIVHRLARALGAGATELSTSTHALDEAREASHDLALALSTRVLSAVNELDRVLRDDPPAIGRSAAELAHVLQSCRAQVPPEPQLGDPTLGERLASLRQSVMDWTAVVVFVLSFTLIARNAIAGHPLAILVQAAIALLSGILIVLRWWRPRWQPFLHLGLILVQIGYGLFMLRVWFTLAPMPPPNFPLLFAASTILAVTIGPMVAWLVLASVVLVSFMMLAIHPGIAWTAPVTLALTYGMLGWGVYHWPRDLLDRLMRERDEALAQIRERRRLVATLFHDLANPLAVIMMMSEDLRRETEEGKNRQDARAMVGRMRATLDSAISGKIVPTVTEAGRLGDDLERLFREPLAKKRLTFRITGDRTVRLRCDETLLRDSVLANLLSNAIKFSPADSTIDFSVRMGSQFVSLLLEDRGPGLPPGVMAALLSGVQAPSRLGTEGEAGTGYGLMLAKDYLTAMGGRLDVAPRDGGGLRIFLSLPAA